jgi:hypothetical protein
MKQMTNTLLMVRPASFHKKEQSAINNLYQKDSGNLSNLEIQENVLTEFDALVKQLKRVGIRVLVLQDTEHPTTPDALFLNNWVSFHEEGTVGLYPMFSPNRRLERSDDLFDFIEISGFEIDGFVDYTSAEKQGYFLEGTGSMVLDRVHRKAYCALSSRTDEELFVEFCEDFEYTPVVFMAFHTAEGVRTPIHHTNLILSIGAHFAVLCLESIDDKSERKNLLQHIKEDGKELLVISEAQAANFAGNLLQVENAFGQQYTVMSEAAFQSLRSEQIAMVEKHTQIIRIPLPTIENYGGRSIGSMLAEVFLPKSK